MSTPDQITMSSLSPLTPRLARRREVRANSWFLALVALVACLAFSTRGSAQGMFVAPAIRLTTAGSPTGSVGFANTIALIASDLAIFKDGSVEIHRSFAENFLFEEIHHVSPVLTPALNSALGAFRIGQHNVVCRLTSPVSDLPFGLAPTVNSSAFLYWYGLSGRGRSTTQTITADLDAAPCPSDLTAALSAVLDYAEFAGLPPSSIQSRNASTSGQAQVFESLFVSSAKAGTTLSATALCPDGQPAQGAATLYAGAHLTCSSTSCTPNTTGVALAEAVLDSGGRFSVAVPSSGVPVNPVLYLDIVPDAGTCTGSVASPFVEFAVNDTSTLWARDFEVRFTNTFSGDLH
jgi:hypothetical protein